MQLRKALESELPQIWNIIQYAIEQRRKDGSKQWQDGYPNPTSIQNDYDKGYAYVMEEEGVLFAYGAVIFDIEPAYEEIEGKWLTNGPYLVVHRVAAAPEAKGKGIGTQFFKALEDLSLNKGVYSIKVDTNFDNAPMLRILKKLGYTYCGEVYFRGSARKAFEKVLLPKSE
ncbi:GCN5-related N-acetyltransferase [Leadbetterella byssophila DSM 17132]|uniref:GCN5-related N-acetyltransferase n=1 Tax=Leadbetterella byssophila (strain DSM 17132 / JCM 16389 / KACC 11308 / NBRC 106382 / 4M15) TaxID=649349 RepID=E4RVE1_LEAB4|nr:GNAT family N-acetyltransferase [Leadbetterella byssophila]ADQ16127.1 GCN5-related N-acetyltransferase [Leadbetterella byssophila DSM 17132]